MDNKYIHQLANSRYQNKILGIIQTARKYLYHYGMDYTVHYIAHYDKTDKQWIARHLGISEDEIRKMDGMSETLAVKIAEMV